MTQRKHIFIDQEQATLRSYNAASGRAGVTVLKLEFEITHPYALAEILRQLAEFKQPATKPARGGSDAS